MPSFSAGQARSRLLVDIDSVVVRSKGHEISARAELDVADPFPLLVHVKYPGENRRRSSISQRHTETSLPRGLRCLAPVSPEPNHDHGVRQGCGRFHGRILRRSNERSRRYFLHRSRLPSCGFSCVWADGHRSRTVSHVENAEAAALAQRPVPHGGVVSRSDEGIIVCRVDVQSPQFRLVVPGHERLVEDVLALLDIDLEDLRPANAHADLVAPVDGEEVHRPDGDDLVRDAHQRSVVPNVVARDGLKAVVSAAHELGTVRGGANRPDLLVAVSGIARFHLAISAPFEEIPIRRTRHQPPAFVADFEIRRAEHGRGLELAEEALLGLQSLALDLVEL
eukprot:scaffold576_cov260-Pinguiococcus_pyrenoidosus.AAC.46